MTTNIRIQAIEKAITKQIQPSFINIIDDSADHIGHAGAQSGAGHFTVEISSDKFAGKSKVLQHQMVYAAVQHMIPDEIHALRILIK